jgi:hypothetical protein
LTRQEDRFSCFLRRSDKSCSCWVLISELRDIFISPLLIAKNNSSNRVHSAHLVVYVSVLVRLDCWFLSDASYRKRITALFFVP